MVEITHTEIFTAIGPAIAKIVKDHVGQYTSPVWGTKNTKNMKNRGFVIGYRDDLKKQRYRIDFDPIKKLHINWEQDTQDFAGHKVRLKECYLVKQHILNPEDEMYTYWRSTTLHHCTELPDKIRDLMGGKHVWYGGFWG